MLGEGWLIGRLGLWSWHNCHPGGDQGDDGGRQNDGKNSAHEDTFDDAAWWVILAGKR